MTEPIQLWQRRIESVASNLRDAGLAAEVLCVLGSGLGDFADRLEDRVECSYEDLEGLPRSSVPGHAGRFVAGTLDGVRVLCARGRVHLYEGLSPFELTLGVRAVARLGVRAALFTNAAGGLRPEWEPGTLMRITDHVNRQGVSPLLPGEGGAGNPWSTEAGLGEAIDAVAEERGIAIQRGVYVAVPGPSYETPAEVRFLREFGGDAVGMSTVLEAVAARAEGMAVAGLSCITNHAAGITSAALNHAEVLEVGRQAAARFGDLLEAALPRLARA